MFNSVAERSGDYYEGGDNNWGDNNRRYREPDVSIRDFDEVNLGTSSVIIPANTNKIFYNKRITLTRV